MGCCQSSDGGGDAYSSGTGGDALGATDRTTKAFTETFTKAVDTVETTFIDFGNIFNRDRDNDLDKAFKKRAEEAREGARRLRDVFAAPLVFDESYVAPVHEKTADEAAFITNALKHNFVFEHLSATEKKTLVCAFEKFVAGKGSMIIEQGEAIGDYFYIIEAGTVKFVVDGRTVGSSGVGGSFGELALLYDCPRAASVVATESCALWRLDQKTFKRILANFNVKSDNETMELLARVAFLKDADSSVLSKMAGALHLRTYEKGEKVVSKGDTAKEFCLIKKGKIVATDIEYGGRKYDDTVSTKSTYIFFTKST